MHHPLKLTIKEIGNSGLRFIDRTGNRIRIVAARPPKDIVHDLLGVSRVIDTNTQTPEVPSAHGTHDVTQTIMAGMPSTLFQTNDTGRHIQLIMSHQDLLQRNFEIVGEAGD